jgi:flagellar export protein FliJ
MKAFEFRLQRVADYRQQQLDLEKNRLQNLAGQMQRLEDERESLERQRKDAERNVAGRGENLTGEDVMALASFHEYVTRRSKEIQRQKTELAAKIEKQRTVVVEAERRVKLLDRLKDRKLQEWKASSDRELDDLAADSHLARLAAQKTTSSLRLR